MNEYLNPWYIWQKPEPEDTLLLMHYGNGDKPNCSSLRTRTEVEILQRNRPDAFFCFGKTFKAN